MHHQTLGCSVDPRWILMRVQELSRVFAECRNQGRMSHDRLLSEPNEAPLALSNLPLTSAALATNAPFSYPLLLSLFQVIPHHARSQRQNWYSFQIISSVFIWIVQPTNCMTLFYLNSKQPCYIRSSSNGSTLYERFPRLTDCDEHAALFSNFIKRKSASLDNLLTANELRR